MDPADSLGTMPPHQFAFGHFSASLNLFARGSRITRQTQRQTFLLRREEKKKISCESLGSPPPPPMGCKSTRYREMKGGEGRQKMQGGFRSSIQFIDGLTALLGPCYAEARYPGKKRERQIWSREERRREGCTILIVLLSVLHTFPGENSPFR